MAQKINVLLIDDLDNSPADETLRYSLDGTAYEIDLSAKNAAEFRRLIGRFTDVSRRIGKTGGGNGNARRRTTTTTSTVDNARIRAWAKENGIAINERGRIPAPVVAKFQEAGV